MSGNGKEKFDEFVAQGLLARFGRRSVLDAFVDPAGERNGDDMPQRALNEKAKSLEGVTEYVGRFRVVARRLDYSAQQN